MLSAGRDDETRAAGSAGMKVGEKACNPSDDEGGEVTVRETGKGEKKGAPDETAPKEGERPGLMRMPAAVKRPPDESMAVSSEGTRGCALG